MYKSWGCWGRRHYRSWETMRFVLTSFFFQAEVCIRDWSVTGVQMCAFFFSSRRRHTRLVSDWSSDVCSSDLLEDLLLVRPAHPVDRIDVALGVVVVEAGLGVHALHRTDHLGGEKYVVGGDNFQEQVDTRLMIDAGVGEDVVHEQLFQQPAALLLRSGAVAG